MTDLQACLPAALRGASITPIAAGFSGAVVYRVEAPEGRSAFGTALVNESS